MKTIGILGMGTMGSAVAAAFKGAGHRVLTDVTGRSATSLARAEAHGIEAAPLAALLGAADVVFSIVPPDRALGVCTAVAEAVSDTAPVFVDANAVAPQTMEDLYAVCATKGIPLVDGGIVGGPPQGDDRPRLYLSGAAAGRLKDLDGLAFAHRDLGDDIGQASRFKMLYAGLTKGLNALLVNQLLAADRAGMFDAYTEELSQSQANLLAQANRVVPRMPADAARWAPEMQEIASSLAELGLPPDFHRGAEQIMRRLAASDFAAETRETVDPTRTLHGTLRGL